MKETIAPLFRAHARYELHPIWWLYLPLAFYVVRYGAYLFDGGKGGLDASFRGEKGIVENLTVILLVVALLTTIVVLVRFGKSLHPAVRLFLVFYCLGCIYFAGEEASWGQHWIGWDTPEYFLQANDQKETNFHNTSVWLDRIPKGIVSLAVFFGGIVVPLWFGFRGIEIDYLKPGWWLWPTRIVLPSAIIATVATWPSKIENETDLQFYFNQAQEVKEVFIASFILLYMVSLCIRLQRMTNQGKEFSKL